MKDTYEDVNRTAGAFVIFDDPESANEKAAGYVVTSDDKAKTITLKKRTGEERVVKFGAVIQAPIPAMLPNPPAPQRAEGDGKP